MARSSKTGESQSTLPWKSTLILSGSGPSASGNTDRISVFHCGSRNEWLRASTTSFVIAVFGANVPMPLPMNRRS